MRARYIFIVGLVLPSLIIGCGARGPVPIHYGTDLCDYCDMTIADQAFGSEMVTTKGKVLKYDSIECLAAAEYEQSDPARVHSRWVTNFHSPGSFLDATAAVIVATERQRSPMGIGLVAVADTLAAELLVAGKGGRIVTWNDTKLLVADAWNLESPR